jgi:DNA-binding NtrC family response regulator
VFSDYALGRMMEYSWPGNIRELENLVKRYVIVGNEPQIIRELSTHKPIVSSFGTSSPSWELKTTENSSGRTPLAAPSLPPPVVINSADGRELAMPSLLEIGRRAAMQAEREAIGRVLAQTRWNRRQAAKILKISYKALLNKLKAMEEPNSSKNTQSA